MTVHVEVDRVRWATRTGTGLAVGLFALFGLPVGVLGGQLLWRSGAYGLTALVGLLLVVSLFALHRLARARIARIESLRFDGRGLHWPAAGGDGFLAWDEIETITVLRGETVTVRIAGPTIVVLRLYLFRNRERILGLLKQRAAHAYRLDDRAEQQALGGIADPQRTQAWRPPPPQPPVPTPVSYRAPAGSEAQVAIDPKAVLLYRPVLLTLGGALLLTGLAVAAFVDVPRGQWHGPVLFTIAALAGGVAMIVVAIVIGAFVEERRRAAFLGRTAVATPHGLRSEDGRRRIRVATEDLRDPYVGSHEHLEELDGDGLTLRSFVDDLAVRFEPIALASAQVAVVEPVDWSPRCFRGRPDRRGAKPLHCPAVLLLQETPCGVLLTRFGSGREYAGDTWHETVAHAEAQIAAELGVTSPRWRQIGMTGPWSFWRFVDDPHRDDVG